VTAVRSLFRDWCHGHDIPRALDKRHHFRHGFSDAIKRKTQFDFRNVEMWKEVDFRMQEMR
jgi:hypothetical protein